MDDNISQNNTIRSQNSVYSVSNLIGAGRFSRVYEATDMNTRDNVVVKVLINKNTDKRFDYCLYLKELNLLNKVKSSPLRIRYVDLREAFQLDSGKMCFVMERLGITLQSVLHNIGRLPMCMCRSIIRQIAQGLTGLKIMRIVHADLKPDNIMFCAGAGNNHQVKIIDFGWAFYMHDASKMFYKTIQAIPYRAPEVCFQKGLDHGIDLWALGCIMTEIATGVKLFDVSEEKHLIRLMICTLSIPPFLTNGLNNKIQEKTNLTAGWLQFLDLCEKSATVEKNSQKKDDVWWFKDLVYKMLVVMPEMRITAVDALVHPFLTMIHFVKYPSTEMTKKNVEMMGNCRLNV